MNTLYLTHRVALAHDMGAGHPERPDRLRAIEARLAADSFDRLIRQQAPLAGREAILRVHPEGHLRFLEELSPARGLARIDGDTAMNSETLEAALRAAGGAVEAVDSVMAGRADNAFLAMRPPGHHAERMTAMGFCFLNNAAIAARHAQAVHGVKRVAIMDFDVHHGNGTQDIFWSDHSVLYASTHQAPLYPGTGAASECGEFDTIVNAPLRAGDGGEAFRDAMENVVLPRIDAFQPDFLILSAGFDAHRRDPLANLNLEAEDFAWATRQLMELADRHAGGRLVSVLEGGYDLEGLAASVAAHVTALMGEALIPPQRE
ncbi:MAG TPA: histone deacetylase family protein [Beijerinckiaceae bacterium]|nr:histone deacetylase family protein [Beijerinckiaceae bacterium]